MNALEYILNKVAEECVELAQAIMKAQNHGPDDHNPKAGTSNMSHIIAESIDVLGSLDLLHEQLRHEEMMGTKLNIQGYPAFMYHGISREMLSDELYRKKAKIAKWAMRSYVKGRLQGDLTVLGRYNQELLGSPVDMYFACDQCQNMDIKDLAYPNHNFFSGPPSIWKCRHCQGKKPSEIGMSLPKYDPKIHDVINRAKPGPTVSMG